MFKESKFSLFTENNGIQKRFPDVDMDSILDTKDQVKNYIGTMGLGPS